MAHLPPPGLGPHIYAGFRQEVNDSTPRIPGDPSPPPPPIDVPQPSSTSPVPETQPGAETARVPETQDPDPTKYAADPVIDDIIRLPNRSHLTLLDPSDSLTTTWFRSCGTLISKSIRRIMHGLLKPGSPTYKKMLKEDKNIWFRTFAHEFNWVPKDTTKVKEEFDKAAASVYKGQIHTWKKSWKPGNNGDPSQGFTTGLCSREVWDWLVVHWSNEKTRSFSQKQSKERTQNRTNGAPPYVHNSGSMSFATRAKRKAIERGGVYPDYLEQLETNHTNKETKEIQDPIVRTMLENVKKTKTAKLTQLTQDHIMSGDTEPPVIPAKDINQWVLEESQRVMEEKKRKGNRYYGLADVPVHDAMRARHSPPVTRETMEEMREEMLTEILENNKRELETMKADLARQMEDDMSRKLQQQMQDFIRNLQRSGSNMNF